MLSPPPPPPPSSYMSTATTKLESPRKSGSNILSQKVARALQVQTDTPAMTAALEALSNLPASISSSSQSTDKNIKIEKKSAKIIDARSVRAAIEQDALQQAILFQNELSRLVQTVRDLRESVTEIKDAATLVSSAIEADVVCVPLEDNYEQQDMLGSRDASKNELKSSISDPNADSDPSQTNDKVDNNESESTEVNERLQEEQNLALLIADAFRARNEAAYRAETVKTFLEKFDLSSSDNYLLDHYAFEEFSQPNNENRNNISNNPNNNEEHNGPAFLEALKRVRNIREQLKNTFDTETFINDHNDDIDQINESEYENLNPHHTASSYSYNRLGATSALRMMETLATKQERAYERLYNWLQTYLRLNETALQHVPTSSAMNSSSTLLQRQQSSQLEADDDDLLDESLAHPFVNNSLIMLKYMPAYYNHILELIAMQRRSEVTRRFLLALTSGYNGMTPIEMKAHDPVNYIGDMLAFIFRAFSVELDLAQGILTSDEGNSFGNEMNQEEKNIDELYKDDDQDINQEAIMTASTLLSHAMSGVTRPLKSRISQVVASLARRIDDNAGEDNENSRPDRRLFGNVQDEPGADIDEEATSLRNRISALFSICGLLLFYHGALEKAEGKLQKYECKENKGKEYSIEVSSTSPNLLLIESIQECLEEASIAYAASVRVYAAMLDSFAALTSSESESTLSNTLIVQISDVRVSSPGFSGSEMNNCAAKIESTLSLSFLCDTLVDSALLHCSSLEDIQALKAALVSAKKAGLSNDRFEHWENCVNAKEVIVVENMIETETSRVLHQCGLGSVWEAFQRVESASNISSGEDDENVPKSLFATQPDLSQPILQAAMNDFYSSLYSPPFPSFNSMKEPSARKNARAKTAAKVAEIYRRIYEGVHSEKGGYEDLSFLGHHPDQVKTLLSL